MDKVTDEQLRRLLVQRLESLRLSGVQHVPRHVSRRAAPTVDAAHAAAATETVRPAAPQAAEPAASAAGQSPASSEVQPSLTHGDTQSTAGPSRDERLDALEQVSQRVARCVRCAELAATRTQTVFGVGNPTARLVVLGEAPGADEDRQGEPFVGRAGQLLNKILAACGMQREDVYILNILKCRPPGNRAPQPAEAANCREYLLRQLEIIQPQFICCLGAVAAQNLLETTKPIGQLRGHIHRFGPIQVVATYHPAYLLRNPSAKRATWDDMQMLLQAMGLPVPEH